MLSTALTFPLSEKLEKLFLNCINLSICWWIRLSALFVRLTLGILDRRSSSKSFVCCSRLNLFCESSMSTIWVISSNSSPKFIWSASMKICFKYPLSICCVLSIVFFPSIPSIPSISSIASISSDFVDWYGWLATSSCSESSTCSESSDA